MPDAAASFKCCVSAMIRTLFWEFSVVQIMRFFSTAVDVQNNIPFFKSWLEKLRFDSDISKFWLCFFNQGVMEIYNLFTTDCSATKWKDQENFHDSPFTPIANHCWTLFIGHGYVCCRYLALVSAFSLSKIKKGEREHEHSKANINYIDLVAKIQQWKGIWCICFYPMLSLHW